MGILFYLFMHVSMEQSDFYIHHEVLYWSGVTSLFLTGVVLEQSDPFFKTPLLPGDSGKPMKTNTIPSSGVFTEISLLGVVILLLPNRHGFLNKFSYRRFKAYTLSMALTFITTALTKDIAGRKRPDYDERLRKQYALTDGRKSYFSGHAALSFSSSVFFSLFLLNDLTIISHPLPDTIIKGILITVLNGYSLFVALTRVWDNKHHYSDIIAGSLVGGGISILGYYCFL